MTRTLSAKAAAVMVRKSRDYESGQLSVTAASVSLWGRGTLGEDIMVQMGPIVPWVIV